MSLLGNIVDIILHLDKYLNVIIQNYGMWTYIILFLIIFCETGLVVTPFLPGDSILFATGAIAAMGSLRVFTLFVVFYAAAVLGDTVNYHIGKRLGSKVFEKEEVKYIKKEYLIKANNFYKKHGSMTIFLGRFIPIVRTFVPFVAGVGEMNYRKFLGYNMFGGFVWVALFLGAGYFFGNLSFIKHNFSYVVIAIVLISVIPAIIAFVKEKKNNTNNENDADCKEIS